MNYENWPHHSASIWSAIIIIQPSIIYFIIVRSLTQNVKIASTILMLTMSRTQWAYQFISQAKIFEYLWHATDCTFVEYHHTPRNSSIANNMILNFNSQLHVNLSMLVKFFENNSERCFTIDENKKHHTSFVHWNIFTSFPRCFERAEKRFFKLINVLITIDMQPSLTQLLEW